MDRVPVERIGSVRGIRAAVSGTGRESPDLQERRRTATLEQERQGNLLRISGQPDDGGPSKVVARWSVAGNRDSGGPIPGVSKQQYAVSSDGQRFLVNLAADSAPPVTLIYNWKPKP